MNRLLRNLRELFHTVYYWLNVKTWVQLVLHSAIKWNVRGLERLPRRGPIILASNHINLADPPIITGLTPRRIVWMTKQELFDIPVFGLMYHMYGCLPVRRAEADLRALRQAQETLRRGLILGMFPEGTRSDGRGLGPGEPGTALIALRTGAPIVPVAIWGTEGIKLPRDFFRRTPVEVVYGEPFILPRPQRITKEAVEEGTAVIMRHIAELLPERYRGIYKESQPRQPQALEATGGTR